MLDWVRLRVTPCHIKPMTLIVALRGPASYGRCILEEFSIPQDWAVHTPGCWDFGISRGVTQNVLTSACWLGDIICHLQRSVRSCAGLSPAPAVPCPSPPMTGTDASIEHLPAPSTWQLRDSPSQSGILSLIPLNGFPMTLSS